MAFSCQGPGKSWPPQTEPHYASQKLLRHNYSRESFQIDLSVTLQLQPWRRLQLNYMPLAALERFQRTESEEAESRDNGHRFEEKETQRAMDTETPSDRDREK